MYMENLSQYMTVVITICSSIKNIIPIHVRISCTLTPHIMLISYVVLEKDEFHVHLTFEQL